VPYGNHICSGIAENEQSGARSKKCSKNKKNYGDDSDENKEIMAGIANGKNPRATCTLELHRKFMEVVKQLSIESKISYFVAYSPKSVYGSCISFSHKKF
jgi:hypothetical protein